MERGIRTPQQIRAQEDRYIRSLIWSIGAVILSEILVGILSTILVMRQNWNPYIVSMSMILWGTVGVIVCVGTCWLVASRNMAFQER